MSIMSGGTQLFSSSLLPQPLLDLLSCLTSGAVTQRPLELSSPPPAFLSLLPLEPLLFGKSSTTLPSGNTMSFMSDTVSQMLIPQTTEPLQTITHQRTEAATTSKSQSLNKLSSQSSPVLLSLVFISSGCSPA